MFTYYNLIELKPNPLSQLNFGILIIIFQHHCRRCGGLFCGSCTQQRMALRGQGDSPVRICEPCKKLEEAARFELRQGRRPGRGIPLIFVKTMIINMCLLVLEEHSIILLSLLLHSSILLNIHSNFSRKLEIST